jgi:hypothetical protein
MKIVTSASRRWAHVLVFGMVLTVGVPPAGAPIANADNRRLNSSVAANVYTIQHQAGCTTDLKISPQLQLAAQWHADDVLGNRALDGDIGSDGSTVQDRANAAGFKGAASETVAINPALAISGIEITTDRTTWPSCPTAPTARSVSGRRTASTAPSSSPCTAHRLDRNPTQRKSARAD